MSINKYKRSLIYKRDGYKCVLCKSSEGLTVDHINPKSNGGSNHINNLRTLCEKCNFQKGNYHPPLWKRFHLFFTRKDGHRLKEDLIGTMCAKDGIVKKEVLKEIEQERQTLHKKIGDDLTNRFNQATPKLTETMRGLISEYKEASDKKSERLLYLFSLLAEKVEELENNIK